MINYDCTFLYHPQLPINITLPPFQLLKDILSVISYFDRTDSVFTERVGPQWHIGELCWWYICLPLHQKEAPSRWETNLWPEQWLLHVLCLRRSHWWLVPPPLFISLIQKMVYSSRPGNILSYMCQCKVNKNILNTTGKLVFRLIGPVWPDQN